MDFLKLIVFNTLIRYLYRCNIFVFVKKKVKQKGSKKVSTLSTYKQ